MKPLLQFICGALVLTLIVACGQKGDLYLPEQQENSVTSPDNKTEKKKETN